MKEERHANSLILEVTTHGSWVKAVAAIMISYVPIMFLIDENSSCLLAAVVKNSISIVDKEN